MRRSVVCALGFTLVLTAVTLLGPRGTGIVNVVRPSTGSSLQIAETNSAPSRDALLPSRLPSSLSAPQFEPAQRDLFAPLVAPEAASAPLSPTRTATVVAELAAPIVPSAPPVDYRFLGRMLTPEGATLVYLTGPGGTVSAKVGESLDSGYVVESLTSETVVLSYPALAVKVAIPLPTEPEP